MVLETLVSDCIFEYKMKIVEFFEEQVKVIHKISINRVTGFLKIETREKLSKELLRKFMDKFELLLHTHENIKVDDEERECYIFNPPRLPADYWRQHKTRETVDKLTI